MGVMNQDWEMFSTDCVLASSIVDDNQWNQAVITSALDATAFIVAHWLCDLVWLSLVSILVYKTKSLWGHKLQEGVFIACSLLLVGFGGWFLVSGIQIMI